jgi:hypothetical protein
VSAVHTNMCLPINACRRLHRGGIHQALASNVHLAMLASSMCSYMHRTYMRLPINLIHAPHQHALANHCVQTAAQGWHLPDPASSMHSYMHRTNMRLHVWGRWRYCYGLNGWYHIDYALATNVCRRLHRGGIYQTLASSM